MPDCNSCGHHTAEPVPFAAHESMKALLDRTIKRLWIVVLILVVLLVASNGLWIWYESQWEDVSVMQEVDTGTGDAFVAGVGDVNYGQDKTNSENAET